MAVLNLLNRQLSHRIIMVHLQIDLVQVEWHSQFDLLMFMTNLIKRS